MAGQQRGVRQAGTGEAGQEPAKLPEGLSLVAKLPGHTAAIKRLAWSPDGRLIASASDDYTVAIWDRGSDWTRRVLPGHQGWVHDVAWSPDGSMIASACNDNKLRIWPRVGQQPLRTIATGGYVWSVAWSPDGSRLATGLQLGPCSLRLWDVNNGGLVADLEGHSDTVNMVAWSPDGAYLASVGDDGVRISDGRTGALLSVLSGHTKAVWCLAWSIDGGLATGSLDNTIRLWDVPTGQPQAVLESHSGSVYGLSFSSDGRLLASQSSDEIIRFWKVKTREPLAVVPITGASLGLVFHHTEPLLASGGDADNVIHVWRIDLDVVLDAGSLGQVVRYTTAKIPLVGDQQVGKTTLGHRLLTGDFKLFPRTHGQQFWPFPSLSAPRADGVECEAILWDLAGQPDYRLTHSLFLDDADLALVLFNATDRQEPLKGVEYWLKVLKSRPAGACPAILVGAQTDVAAPSLTQADLDAFCRAREITGGYVATSASTGAGIDDLIERLRQHIPWDRLLPTTTTVTFKRVKDYVVGLKVVAGVARAALLTPGELRAKLEATDPEWTFTDAEMLTAVGHLANHGFVTMLKASSGETRVLLQPDLLINLTASIVLEARRNPKGLGALQEAELRRGATTFPELEGLDANERQALLDAAIALFLQHHVCFRETLGVETLFIFPALIHQHEPPADALLTVDDATYAVEGAVEHLYSKLVVLLGYTNTVTRSSQWFGHARYELGGAVCGIRSVGERDGELRLVLYYGHDATPSVRRLFEGLVETFLQARGLKVTKYPAVSCPKCRYHQERDEIVKRVVEQRGFVRCSECGERIELPRAGEPLSTRAEDQALLERERDVVRRRTTYEAALSRVKALVRDRGDGTTPTCFVSYAWGVREHERWVARLVQDLKNADVQTIFDRQDNAALGLDIARFISDGLTESAFVVVVGTSSYYDKYQNKVSNSGSIVAAEVDLIHQRLTADEARKRTVVPVLLEGDPQRVFPPLLRGRVRADFTDERSYFAELLDLVLTFHHIDHADPAVADLRDLVRDRETVIGRG